ncbi:MAG: hypothetical protein ACFCUX_01405 [Candidatus Methylacidiphilales bacterium]
MKNFDAFERQLNESQRVAGKEDSRSGLARLRHDLIHVAVNSERSSFHQSTAWVRLEARMQESTESPIRVPFWLKLSSYAATAAVAATVVFLLSESNKDPGGILPEISDSRPGIYATPFYSKEAKAEVIWAEGYQYIPAGFTY